MSDYRPQIPASDRALPVNTFADAYWEVLDAFDIDETGRHGRVARRAVLEAYRDLPNLHRWSYYRTMGEIVTVASQDDGTIAYDHTGGVSGERLVTLTGSTWPTDARLYELVVANVIYKVESYVSSTEITLTADTNPGADVASGTSYQLYRRAYPLPVDFRKGSELTQLTQAYWPAYVPPDEMLGRMTNAYSPQTNPDVYTIRSTQEYYGGLMVEFAPPPSETKVYSYIYERDPRPLQMFGRDLEYSDGSISISGTAVTGTGTAFTSAMVGCMLRLPQAGASNPPTGYVGSDKADEPYAEQRVIQRVTSATVATIDVAPAGTYAGVKYTIGSPLDIALGAMYSALMRLTEANFARMISRSEKLDTYGAPQRVAVFKAALKEAMSADNRNRNLQPSYWYVPYSLADIAHR